MFVSVYLPSIVFCLGGPSSAHKKHTQPQHRIARARRNDEDSEPDHTCLFAKNSRWLNMHEILLRCCGLADSLRTGRRPSRAMQ